MSDHTDANRRLESAVAAKASAALRKDLQLAHVIVAATEARGATPAELRALIDRQLSEINPQTKPFLEHGVTLGLRMGRNHAGGDAGGTLEDPDLQALIDSTDTRIKARLEAAVALADKLPMTEPSDTSTVMAKAQSSIRISEADAAWAVHRSIANGVAEVAKAEGLNVVWVAERNACPTCLAYQGHVVAPGKPFPPGLTYGDRPIKPYGALIGPPLHTWCRCELETTDLEAGSLDVNLAREAARSVARGLTDYQSEVGKQRAVDRLLKGTTGLPAVSLPKSVLDRARRNLADKQFKARPGSPQARAEIAQRVRDRARSTNRPGRATGGTP